MLNISILEHFHDSDDVINYENCSTVTVNKHSPGKRIPNNYLRGSNNYSPSTYALVNNYSLQKITTPLK